MFATLRPVTLSVLAVICQSPGDLAAAAAMIGPRPAACCASKTALNAKIERLTRRTARVPQRGQSATIAGKAQ